MRGADDLFRPATAPAEVALADGRSCSSIDGAS